MPDPFGFTDPMTQPYLGGAGAAPASLVPSGLPQRSAAGTMIAPITPRPTAPQPAPTPVAPQPTHSQSPGNVDQFMQLVRTHESGGNDQASSGVADGRYQFTPQTWAGVSREHPELGLQPNDIWNGSKQDLAMRAVSQDYVNVLKINGIAPTMPNMFMLHFLGTGGGPKFLKEMAGNPNANAAALFPLEAKYNPTIFHDKAGQPRSLQQVYALMTKTFGGPQMQMAPANPETLKAIDSFQGAQALANPQVTGSLEEVDLPPLPPGAKMDAPIEMPPLPPGAKLDYNSTTPMTTNPYADDKASKSDTPTSQVIGVDTSTGMPIYADPKDNEELQKEIVSTGKGIAAGIAEDITGPASLFPPPPGSPEVARGAGERLNADLASVGDPASRKVGNLIGMAAPIGEAGAAINTGARAAAAGESLVPSMLKGIGLGGFTGALSESSNPTGQDTYGGQLAAKAPAMLKGGFEGAVLGAIPGGIELGTRGAQWLGGEFGGFGKFVTDAFGREAKKAAEDLRSGINSETGKALTAEEQKAAQAKVEEGAARAKQAVADAQLKHLDEQQERLRNRMQDRVKAAEKVAERAGQNAEQAKAFAADQERAVAKAEESANKLAADFAARPTMKVEEFGRQLQETATKDAEALKAARAEQSGFEAAVKSDGGQPSIPTKQFISAVSEAEKRAVSPSTKSALAALKEELRSPVAGGRVSMVSIQRARRIVQDLDSRIEGMPSDEAHEITALKSRFVEHMETVHKQLATAREKYAELSRPLDVYRDTGALTKSVLEDPYSGRVILDPTKTVGALLNKTEAGADALGRMVKANPQLQDSARKFFNQRLVDIAGKNPTPSEAQFANFLRDNRLALDRAGLTNEFKDLAAAKTTQERIAAQAKSGADAAKRVAGEAEQTAKAAERDVNATKMLKDRAASPSTLKAQREPAEEARKQSVKELADAASKQKAAQDVQEHLAKLDNKLDPKVARTGKEITTQAEHTADYLKDRGYIDAEAHKALLTKIRDVEQMNLDHTRAAKLVKQAIIAAAVLGLGVREVGSFVSHRVTP